MLVLLTSPHALLNHGHLDPQIIQSLKAINSTYPVGVISNHPKPEWFDDTFVDTKIVFIQRKGRQNGAIINEVAKTANLTPHNIIVLASTDTDLQMAKNGGALLVGAGWSADKKIAGLGLKVDSGTALQELFRLTDGWSGQWWFKAAGHVSYTVRALVDLSSYGNSLPASQIEFSNKLTKTVKGGGNQLSALLAVAARSLTADGFGKMSDQFWGVYPSSKNTAKDDEVLTEFSHRLRTTLCRYHFAKQGEPLFIRHTEAPKRSHGQGGDREDPTEQIISIHLNPEYRASLRGRNVIVLDDCTTYGVSFGVAAAFLLKAGAASVHGVALGKLGNRAQYYEISINSDPFTPVTADSFTLNQKQQLMGETDGTAQQLIRRLIS